MIPVYKPYIDKYKESAIKAIDSNWISNYGIYVKNTEFLLQQRFNVKYCILMCNGTAATHCLFMSLRYKHPNINKIYVPNNVFIGAWNCCLMEYPKEIIEVMRIIPATMNIDTSEEYIKQLDENSAILIVHNLGNIVNVPKMKRMRPDIIFIEDNCEGLFGKYENIYSGTFRGTLCSSCSFYANKTLTTGEGGAFFTNDTGIYEYINSIYSHGMTNQRYIHDKMAYNYRMTNIQAAFLYEQVNDSEHIITLKYKLFENYDKLLKEYMDKEKVIKIKNENNTISANWMYCIIIPKSNFKQIEKFMNDKMIQIRPFFYDIRTHHHLKDLTVHYPEVTSNGIMLPSYPGLKEDQQEYIINCLNEYITSCITP